MFTWEMAYTIPRPGCWISVTHLSHRRTEINNSLGQPFKQRKEDVTRNYRGVSKQAWLMAAACGTVSGHCLITFRERKKKKSYRSRYTFLALLTQWQLTDVYVHLSECGMEMNVCARRDPGTQLVGSAGERHRRERRVSSSQIRAKAETDPLSNRGFRLCVSLAVCVCFFADSYPTPSVQYVVCSDAILDNSIRKTKRKKNPFGYVKASLLFEIKSCCFIRVANLSAASLNQTNDVDSDKRTIVVGFVL